MLCSGLLYGGTCQAAKIEEPKPKIEFLRPGPNDVFKDKPIYVQVKVSNFNLLPPVEYWSKPGDQKSGHIHYTLDDYPIFATDRTQVMLGKKSGNQYLSNGKHVIRAELVTIDHSPLKPKVVAQMTVSTSHPVSAQEEAQNQRDIQKLQTQLFKVQEQLDQIQNTIQQGKSTIKQTTRPSDGKKSKPAPIMSLD